MIRTIRENRLIQIVIVASLLNLLGGGLGVFMSWQARQENCDHVREAFDEYTEALIGAAQPDEPRTPEAQEAFELRIQHFREAYKPALEKCS